MLRESINKNRTFTIGISSGIILLMLGFTYYRLNIAGNDRTDPVETDKQWVTTDFGKSWLAVDINRLPPFEMDGKTAYGCALWSTDAGKTVWVSHLYRYTDEGKKRISASEVRALLRSPMRLEMMEVRRPGENGGGWFKATDPKGVEVQLPEAVDKGAVPVPVPAK